ncbi:MAG: hypothetical protein FJ279_09955 [Planctomycetes bacterium]|nr:hypothetical protein [Planctomycetota bacterium]MBM4084010.1 hypothetical protein [Planctomycetota bacterium]
MPTQITGKVAKILDEYNLIINVGREHGVTQGLGFVVFTEGEEVIDPDTRQPLAKWEIVKGRIVAAHVQDRITVCTAVPLTPEKNVRVDPSTRTLSAAMVRDHMRGEFGGARSEKLNVNRAQMSGMPELRPISIGDRVRSLEGRE